MARIRPFEEHSDLYEEWFTSFPAVFDSEVTAIAEVLPEGSRSIEIGVGSGLFAERLGIPVGVEPSEAMAIRARARGISVLPGVAEELPVESNRYESAFMVTAICFVDEPQRAINEMVRVVEPGGSVVIAFVDRDSELGQQYLTHKEENVFYRDADFYSATEILEYMKEAGLIDFTIHQTLFGPLEEIAESQRPHAGYGEGGFVVISGRVPTAKQLGDSVWK